MKPRTLTMLFFLFAVLLFAGPNWSVLNESRPLDLIVYEMEAPIGVTLLIVIAVLTVLYLFVLGKIKGMALLESRQNLKELEKARRVADAAESSRLKGLEVRIDHLAEELIDRLDALAGNQKKNSSVKVERDVAPGPPAHARRAP